MVPRRRSTTQGPSSPHPDSGTTSAREETQAVPCPHCGVIDRPLLSPGTGPHAIRASCPHCGKFLRWISVTGTHRKNGAQDEGEARGDTSAPTK